MPDLSVADIKPLEARVREYFRGATAEREFELRAEDSDGDQGTALRSLHWRIDAEVLRLYGLSRVQERRLLDYFAGWSREGVPFRQTRYFPEHFSEALSLVEYVAINDDWDSLNRRRLRLIAKKQEKGLTEEERPELEHLKRLARAKVHLTAPLPEREMAAIEHELRRKNQWLGE